MRALARFFAALARFFDRPDSETAAGMLKRIVSLEARVQDLSVHLADTRVQVAKAKMMVGLEQLTSVRPDEV